MAGRPLTGRGEARAEAGNGWSVTSGTLVRKQEEKGMALSRGPLEATPGLILTLESPPRWAAPRHTEFSPSAIDLARGIWSSSHFRSRLWLSVGALGVPEHPRSCWAVPAPGLRSQTKEEASRRRASRKEPFAASNHRFSP